MTTQDCSCGERQELIGHVKLTGQMQTICREVGRELRSQGDILEKKHARPLGIEEGYNVMIEMGRNFLALARFIFQRCLMDFLDVNLN